MSEVLLVCLVKVDERQDADFRQNPHGEDHNPRGGWAGLWWRDPAVGGRSLTKFILALKWAKSLH